MQLSENLVPHLCILPMWTIVSQLWSQLVLHILNGVIGLHIMFFISRYTKDACQSLCIQSHILDLCGCLYSNVLSHATLISRHPFCSLYNASDPQKTIQEEKCPAETKARLERSRLCHDMCDTPCVDTSYSSTITQVITIR